MRKLLPSPLSSRRKSGINSINSSNSSNSTGSSSPPHSNSKVNGHTNAKCKIFGAPLSSYTGIPFIVTRLCSYIECESGFQQEGLFRISGNVKLIEKLKNLFDLTGDAPLEEIADVPSAAALVKLYFRELPEPLIPANIHQILFQAARDYSNSHYYLQQQEKLKEARRVQQQQLKEQGDSCQREENNGHSCNSDVSCKTTAATDEEEDDEAIRGKERHCTYIQRIRALVSILPSTNFYTLRYLCCFLNRVSRCESSNRMNAASLGIVFGPTVFRISTQEYTTLRDEAIDGPNQVVTALITECHSIFDPVADPSFSTSAATVILLDQHKSVILSGCSRKKGTSKTKKGASIDLCELRQSSLHQTKRNFSQDESDFKASTSSPSGKKTLSKKKATIVPIVVLSHTDDDTDLSVTNVTGAMNDILRRESVTQQSNRRKRLLSSSNNLIRSVSEERATCSLKGSFDSITNELRRCASSDSLIKSKHDPTTLAAVVAATTASLLFPPCSSLVPPSVVATSASPCPSSSSNCNSPSSDSEKNNSGTSIETVVLDNSTLNHHQDNEKDKSLREASIDTKDCVTTTDEKCARQVDIETSGLGNDLINTQSSNSSNAPYVTVVLAQVDQSKNGNKYDMIDESNDAAELKDTHNFDIINCKEKVNVQVNTDDNNNTTDGNINVMSTIKSKNNATNVRNSWPAVSSSNCVSVVVTPAFVDEITSFKMEKSSMAALCHSVSSIVEPEAPVSPSAYRSYLTRKTSEHLLSVAPSPPLEQDNYCGFSKINILQSAAVKSVKRQISSLKKQLREYEGDFVKRHGYPPSMDQKMNSTFARPVVLELNKLKKSLKDFKQGATNDEDDFLDERYFKESDLNEFLPSLLSLDCEDHLDSQLNIMKKCTVKKCSSSEEHFNSDWKECSSNCTRHESDANILRELEEQLQKLQESMNVRRMVCNRPEDITLMTAGQIMDEKSDLQRELLKFESIYGHPACEKHRHIMRPIYDRYRCIKRLVAGMPTVNTITVEVSNSTLLEKSKSNTESVTPGHSSKTSPCKFNSSVNCFGENYSEQRSSVSGESTTDANEPLESICKNVAIDFNGKRSIVCSNSSSRSNSCSSTSSSKSNSGPLNGTVTMTTSATIVAISPSDLARIKKQQGAPLTSKVVNLTQKKHSISAEMESIGNSDIIQYHEMSLGQLMEQLNRSRIEKKQLKRIIRSLEEDMSKKLGRKIEKEDRIQPVYTTHKQVKGKLRLLKALVAKYEKGHHPSRMSL